MISEPYAHSLLKEWAKTRAFEVAALGHTRSPVVPKSGQSLEEGRELPPPAIPIELIEETGRALTMIRPDHYALIRSKFYDRAPIPPNEIKPAIEAFCLKFVG